MATAKSMKKGQVLRIDGELYIVLDAQHITPGNWRGFVQANLRSMRTGKGTNRRFRSVEEIETVDLRSRKMQFLYRADGDYHFMDLGDYSTVPVSGEVVGDPGRFLAEGMETQISFCEEDPVSVDLPASVELKVTSTAPGIKGDTVTNVTKPAALENGMEVSVPLFVKEGDVIKVSTQTGEYLSRA